MKPVSAVDVAKSYLEERIVKGAIPPGQQIKEGDVSTQLDISRPPIREAFKILEGEGLIVRKPNRGVFVSQIREKDVWEVYSLLEALYELALYLAFDLISEREIKKLEGLVLEMESCVERHSPKVIGRYQDLNSRFHSLFAQIVGHQRLGLILSNLSIQIRRLSYQAFLDKEHMRRSNQAHRAILEAIRRKDREKAAALIRHHMQAIAATHRRIAVVAGGLT
jgi:DNA-binding GntR family transcriptional regulator